MFDYKFIEEALAPLENFRRVEFQMQGDSYDHLLTKENVCELRESLKALKTELLILMVWHQTHESTAESGPGYVFRLDPDGLKKFTEKLADIRNNNAVLDLECLGLDRISKMFFDTKVASEIKKRVKSYMIVQFTLNNFIMSINSAFRHYMEMALRQIELEKELKGLEKEGESWEREEEFLSRSFFSTRYSTEVVLIVNVWKVSMIYEKSELDFDKQLKNY